MFSKDIPNKALVSKIYKKKKKNHLKLTHNKNEQPNF